MKEVGYHHLNLDSFFSCNSDVGERRMKSLKQKRDGNKENCGAVNGSNSSTVNGGRAPLGNITNTKRLPQRVQNKPKQTTINTKEEPCLRNSVVHTNVDKSNHHDKLKSLSLSMNFVEDTSTTFDYDIAETSTISELQADDGDLFCDDEYQDIDDGNEILDTAAPDGYATLGPPTECCNKCHAVMWKEESANKNVKHGVPKFSTCCCQGQIKLPCTPSTPPYLLELYNDPRKSNAFKRNIQLYNSMFAFTSMGGKKKKILAKCEKALTNLNVNIATMNQQYEELNNNYKEFRLNFIATMKHQQEEVNKTLSEFTCNFNKQQEMLNEEIQRLRIEAKKMRDTFKPPSN
ncbi:hypothetical protein POM88_006527 [Heracleum sosnowskyi]|uniref:Uncharacterized protein n=1 Tax=Heracleum sosnowskyi TaxID=360622 RepID=A0AAD8N4U5_9APIA|nr:hypothetical protein POM88_006527 [Heracleum sosnowskyi]